MLQSQVKQHEGRLHQQAARHCFRISVPSGRRSKQTPKTSGEHFGVPRADDYVSSSVLLQQTQHWWKPISLSLSLSLLQSLLLSKHFIKPHIAITQCNDYEFLLSAPTTISLFWYCPFPVRENRDCESRNTKKNGSACESSCPLGSLAQVGWIQSAHLTRSLSGRLSA